ncbi:ABC transporter, ATP-binding protein [Lentisphaera araneosa HTCC2155]|jgi:ABC-2 type transport system ATP-binding protein|uniref:ABC transporter, ATP-binding protein n=1 Tax=Lentisphaera araneosa HTCC2155 TaxID=313628 RepID=A6DMN9_9BACT|nr:ABC transporter ATP-binding protein [Lentisphaera araneosa]EDM27229.1 ABC transporter, ATP-binding protein [Lentisphaera araneosa HTCC2155]
MIELNSLSKSFGNGRGIHQVSFTVPEGSIMGFVGHNGAGKTTTFKILTGLMDPDSGSATIDGIPVKPRNLKKLKQSVGYMPDIFGVYERMTVWQYLDFFGAAYRIPRKLRKERILKALDLTRSGDMVDYQVASLSRGMRQRVGLAKTILPDPKVLILDEPAGGLDPQARIEMREVVCELRDVGKTIILSSHILPDLGNMCDLVGIINKGNMEAFGKLDDITESLTDKKTYVIEVHKDDLGNAQQFLSNMGSIKDIQLREQQISFSCDKEEDLGAKVLAYLIENNIRVNSFKLQELELEEMFMQLAAK